MATITPISSDKDTHFTTELTQGAMETESINMSADMITLDIDRLLIIGLVLQASQNNEYDVIFWRTSSHDNTDLDLDKSLGYVNFSETDGKQVAGTNQYRYPSENLKIFYRDEDQSNKIHVGLVNRSITTKEASDTIHLTFFVIPHV
jgi:hypothetical protein